MLKEDPKCFYLEEGETLEDERDGHIMYIEIERDKDELIWKSFVD